MSDVNTWALLAADNTQPPPDGAPEGIAKIGQLNDIISEMQAAIARIERDRSFVTGTLAGGVLTVNGTRSLAAHYDGLRVLVLPDAANTGAVTARYKTLPAAPLRRNGNELAAGDIKQWFPLDMVYLGGVWHLLSHPGTTTTAAVLEAAVAGLRIPVGGFFWSIHPTNPNFVTGYGEWELDKGYLVAAGAYQDGNGHWQEFAPGAFTGTHYLNFANGGNAAGAVGQHDHGTTDHQHIMTHGHPQTAHEHQVNSHDHAMDHQHFLPGGALMEVPFGTPGSLRLRIGPSDTTNIVSVLPISGSYNPATSGATLTRTAGSGNLQTSRANANVSAFESPTAWGVVDVHPNASAGFVAHHPYSRVAYRWIRTA